jgi:hypothetical protein
VPPSLAPKSGRDIQKLLEKFLKKSENISENLKKSVFRKYVGKTEKFQIFSKTKNFQEKSATSLLDRGEREALLLGRPLHSTGCHPATGFGRLLEICTLDAHWRRQPIY